MKALVLSASLSGILYVLSFAPWDLHVLQWFAFVPLLWAADRIRERPGSLKATLLAGTWMSMIICFGGFYWMVGATMRYGGLPLPAALGVFLAFSLTGQLQVPLYLWLRDRLLRQSSKTTTAILVQPLLLGIFYAGIESLYPKVFLDTAGHAFQASLRIRQAADIGGVFFLTFLSLVVNEGLTATFRSKKRSPAALALGLIVLTLAYGQWRVNQHAVYEAERTPSAPQLKVSMIQANIGDFVKVAAEQGTHDAMTTVLEQYLGLSRKAVEGEHRPDAVIWPETAYPSIFGSPESPNEKRMESRLLGFLESLPGTLIFGGYDRDLKGVEYNSLFFHQASTPSTRVYHKNVLLMFGETLPFAESFPSMKTWFPTMGFFGRGPGPEVIEVKNKEGRSFRMAPSICYEGLIGEHSAKGALLGADALLNVTNDSWFGPDGEPYLHLALTRFRTVETRLPLLRSTNTGFSVWMDALGETRGQTGLFESAVLNADIQHRTWPLSPYLEISRSLGLMNWFERICQILTLIFTGIFFARRLRST